MYIFLHNCKCKTADRRIGSLITPEIKYSETSPNKLVQNSKLQEEMKDLRRELRVLLSSNVKGLALFLDKNNSIRGSGRLENSYLSFVNK